jgi:hypothetical protein
MMKLKLKVKDFYKTWLEPPGVRAWRTRPQGLELQKFWNGEDVPFPRREANFSRAAGLSDRAITRQDETRPCLLIEGAVVLEIPDGTGAKYVQVGLTADKWRPDSTVSLEAGPATVRHTRFRAGRWLDVRLELPDGGADALRVATDQPLWVTIPRAVHQVVSDAPRHVLVLVMDGMARRALEAMKASARGPITPNIDRFFESGFHAPLGFSASDWTLPTTSSFFTGKLPSAHGMVHPRREMHHREDDPLLAERFQGAGYHALLMSCGNRLTPAFDVHRGVDRLIYHSGDSNGHDLDSLERPPASREQGLQLLRVRLTELDRLLGGLFDWIDREAADHAVVVLTADHGSPWLGFPDPLTGPKINLSEFRTGIEFRMRGAGVPQKVEERVVCPNLDLLPTLSGLMGWVGADLLDGVDLLDPSANREYCITECLYRTEYEIAVNDAEGQWIEKHPLDEETNRVTGPATWKGWFSLGSTSFGEPLRDHDPYREAIVQQHLSSRGILA